MWGFLESDYRVTANHSCSTHVHLSLAEGYSATHLKRLAQAVIHFEPAVEALVPQERRGNEFARSNWIDNKRLGYRRLSRPQSIMEIEACDSIEAVIDLMNPENSKYFGWNILSIKQYGTVEFRRGAASTTVADVMMWIGFAMSFLRAAIQVSAAGTFGSYAATIGGLRKFIQDPALIDEPGTFSSQFLARLFDNHTADEWLEPRPVGNLTPQQQEKLEKKIKADALRNPMLAKIDVAQ